MRIVKREILGIVDLDVRCLIEALVVNKEIDLNISNGDSQKVNLNCYEIKVCSNKGIQYFTVGGCKEDAQKAFRFIKENKCSFEELSVLMEIGEFPNMKTIETKAMIKAV